MQQEEIDDFLMSGYWDISRERTLTRRACAEVLERLPENVVEEIVHQQKVILITP